MYFNSDKNKQAQEVVFSRKQSKPQHPRLLFNNVPVGRSSLQKYLGVLLVEKLSFSQYIKVKIQKAVIGINVIKKLSNFLHRQVLLTIYKLFVTPHLDYGDIIYGRPNNESLCQTIEAFNIRQLLSSQVQQREHPRLIHTKSYV